MTKREFARFKRRSPACVSHWLKHGHISGAALIGQGRRARIWVERAEFDLQRSLDVSQQFAQRVPANEARRTGR
jgi:hypothetical protein